MAGGHKLWAVGEEFIQADLQQYLADQIYAVFTNNTARDAGWPSPPNGAVCISNGVKQQYFTGTGWYLAGGVLGWDDRNTDAGPQGAEGTISSVAVTVTVTLPANRYILPEFTFSRCNGDTVNSEAMIRIKDNGTTIWEHQVAIDADLAGSGGVIGRPYKPASGSHAYTVTLQGIGGNVTVIAGTSGNSPMTLTVRDLGGV